MGRSLGEQVFLLEIVFTSIVRKVYVYSILFSIIDGIEQHFFALVS